MKFDEIILWMSFRCQWDEKIVIPSAGVLFHPLLAVYESQ